jgi:hypothetical protein
MEIMISKNLLKRIINKIIWVNYKKQHNNPDEQMKRHKFKYKDRDGDLAHSSLSALLSREVEVSKENDK